MSHLPQLHLCQMRRLPEVEEAKELMNEAMEWSVFKWLWEKGRVRETADRANAALDKLERRVLAGWPEELKAGYKEFRPAHPATKKAQLDPPKLPALDPETTLFLEKMKRADDRAHRARMDAEKTFDEAERLLNTTLAKEGCEKAIHSWTLKEQAIRQAEAAISSKAKT